MEMGFDLDTESTPENYKKQKNQKLYALKLQTPPPAKIITQMNTNIKQTGSSNT